MAQQGFIPRLLQAIAGLARSLANILERMASDPRRAVQSAALQSLAERFPGAPDHWLQVIADRAPHLAQAPRAEAAPASPPIAPPARLRLTWPRWRRTTSRHLAPTRPRTVRASPQDWEDPQTELDPFAAPVEFADPPMADDRPLPPAPSPARAPRPKLRFTSPAMCKVAPELALSEDLGASRLPGPSTEASRGAAVRTRPVLALGRRALSARPAAPGAIQRRNSDPSTAPEFGMAEPWSDRAGRGPSWPRLDEATAQEIDLAADAAARTLAEPQTWRSLPPRSPRRSEPPPPDRRSAIQPRLWDRGDGRGRPPAADVSGHEPATERAAFLERHDGRWPELPPAGCDEVAEAPTNDVARHIREQEEGGWNA